MISNNKIGMYIYKGNSECYIYQPSYRYSSDKCYVFYLGQLNQAKECVDNYLHEYFVENKTELNLPKLIQYVKILNKEMETIKKLTYYVTDKQTEFVTGYYTLQLENDEISNPKTRLKGNYKRLHPKLTASQVDELVNLKLTHNAIHPIQEESKIGKAVLQKIVDICSAKIETLDKLVIQAEKEKKIGIRLSRYYYNKLRWLRKIKIAS